MKIQINGIIYLLFSVLIVCCESNIYKKNELLQLPITKTKFILNIPDTSTYAHDISQILEENGSFYFFGLDIRRNLLDVFDIKKNIYHKKVGLNRNDSIKINGVDMFYVSSLNEIFLFKRYPSTIIMTDSSFKNYNLFKVPDNFELNGKNIFLMMHLYPLSKSVYYEKLSNKLYFPIYNYEQKTFKIKWELPIIASYSISNKKIINVFANLPEKFKSSEQGIKYSIYYEYPNFAYKDSILIVSFANDHLIYVYNTKNGNLISQNNTKSNYIEDFKIFNYESSPMQAYNFCLSEPAYINIIYDKYRKIFYRICKHEQILKNEGGEKHDFFDCAWSLVVMNDDFLVIGEINMPKGKFNFYNILPVKDGLLIQDVNPKEGFLSFELLDIENAIKKIKK